MDPHLNTKRIVIFLAFAFGINWTASLAYYLTGGANNMVINPDLAVVLLNYVFVVPAPALANVVTRLITKEGWGHFWLRPNLRRGWRFYLAAWLLPLLVTIPGGLAYYLLFPQSFDPNLPTARNDAIPFPVAGIASPWMVLLSYTLQYMILQVLVAGVFALGEESGWRAYLLQRLIGRFSSAGNADTAASARKAALLVGVIWSVWHLPVFLMQWEANSLFPGAFFLFMLLYTVNTTSQGVLLAWAVLRSGSVWPAAIGHATILGVCWVASAALKGPPDTFLNPSPDGLVGNLGFVVLALVLLFSRWGFAGEQEARPERAPVVAIPHPG